MDVGAVAQLCKHGIVVMGRKVVKEGDYRRRRNSRQAAEVEQRGFTIDRSYRPIGSLGQGLFEALERFFQAVKLADRDAPTVQRFSRGWLDRQRSIIGSELVVEAL